MITKKQLVPGIAAMFILTGCGAAANTAASHGTTAATDVAAHSANGSDGIPAGALPFPVAVGDTWVYRSTAATGGGNDTNLLTNKITSVVSTSQGTEVTESYSNNADSRFNGSTVWIFHPNGTITFPVAEDLGVQITHSSGGILLPSAAQAASGKPLHSTISLSFVVDGKTYTETGHVTAQGAGTQTVTVPAGTYQNATVLDLTFDASVDGISLDLQLKYWIAKGVGQVKSSVSTGGSSSADTEVLVSFTKG
jgi:hypothetical protein